MPTINKWTNVAVSIQSALAAADTITAITKADPGVVSAASHGISDGAYVLLDVTGMSQVDDRVFRVANGDAGTFQIEGEDTTAYNTFTAGSAQEITFGTALSTVTTVNSSGGERQFEAVTTIHDDVAKEVPGIASAKEISFESIWDPSDAGLVALKAASDAAVTRAVMVAFSSGARLLFNAYVDCDLVPGGQAGGVATTQVTLRAFGKPTVYAS